MIAEIPKINFPRGKPIPAYVRHWVLQVYSQTRGHKRSTAKITKLAYNTVKKIVENKYKQSTRWEGISFIKDPVTHEFVRRVSKIYPHLTNFEVSVLYHQILGTSISTSSIRRVRKHLKLTWKKFTDYNIKRKTPSIINLRNLTRNFLKNIPAHNFIFIDETHVNTESSYQLRGYGPQGKELVRHVDNDQNNSRSVIGAMSENGLILAHVVDTRKIGIRWVHTD
jgi:hypothetical protein